MAQPQRKWDTAKWSGEVRFNELELERTKRELDTDLANGNVEPGEYARNMVHVYLQLGECSERSAEEKAADFRRAAQAAERLYVETDGVYANNLAVAYFYIDPKKARRILTEAIGHDNEFALRANLIEACARCGDLQATKDAIRAANEALVPEVAEHHFRIAHALAVAGFDEDAVGHLLEYAKLKGTPATESNIDDVLADVFLRDLTLYAIDSLRTKRRMAKHVTDAKDDEELLKLAEGIEFKKEPPEGWASAIAKSIVQG